MINFKLYNSRYQNFKGNLNHDSKQFYICLKALNDQT